MTRSTIIQLPVARAPRRGYQAPVPVADFSDLEKRLRDDLPVHLSIEEPPTLADDWHAFWTDVADAPVHHSVFALVVFIASCVLIYGSAYVIVEVLS